MKAELLTDDDFQIISNAPHALLAKAYCVLNSWGWPEGFRDPMTKRERLNQREHHSSNRGFEIMIEIQRVIGEELCSKIWNTGHPLHQDQIMTIDEWKDWWQRHH